MVDVHRYEWLLFDLDNTLLDFDQAAYLSFVDMMTEMDLPSDTQHFNLYNEINHQLWNTLESGTIHQSEIKVVRWERYFDQIKIYRDAREANDHFFAGLAKHPIEVEGALDTLASLKDSHKMCLITNGIGEVQRPRIKAAGIDLYFDAVVISDEIGTAKPQGGFFDHTFDQIDQPSKTEVLVIGDKLGSDIRGGQNYGVDTCWYNPKAANPYGNIYPTYDIQSMRQILPSEEPL